MRLETAASRSRVKHSTTEPLRSLGVLKEKLWGIKIVYFLLSSLGQKEGPSGKKNVTFLFIILWLEVLRERLCSQIICLFLDYQVQYRVNIIKIVSKHPWDRSTELRFYTKNFFECQEKSMNFLGTFRYFKVLACEHAFVGAACWSEHGKILPPPPPLPRVVRVG